MNIGGRRELGAGAAAPVAIISTANSRTSMGAQHRDLCSTIMRRD